MTKKWGFVDCGSTLCVVQLTFDQVIISSCIKNPHNENALKVEKWTGQYLTTKRRMLKWHEKSDKNW